jgi:hypothetical protein
VDGPGVLNKNAERVLLVAPFGGGIHGMLFKVVGMHIETGNPFHILLPGDLNAIYQEFIRS